MAELSNAADKAGAAKRLAESAAEEATEVVVEEIRNHISWMWGGFTAGFSLGAVGGFFGAKKYLEPKYEKIAENEIDQMREHFRKRMMVREDKPDLGDLNEVIRKHDYKSEPIVRPPVPVDPPAPGTPNVRNPSAASEKVADQLRNVFDTGKDPGTDWDWDVEKALRTQGGTYVIHKEEYGETDNNEVTLSYYAGDDVLCDQQDRIVDNQYSLVADCLNKFGHGSHDRNVVYVRNEELEIDMEVIKSDKTYAEEVHGFKHEDPPRKRVPKYRDPRSDSR
jgi:hypothetical protein